MHIMKIIDIALMIKNLYHSSSYVDKNFQDSILTHKKPSNCWSAFTRLTIAAHKRTLILPPPI